MKGHIWIAFIMTAFCIKGNAAPVNNIYSDPTLRILYSGQSSLLWHRTMNVIASAYGFEYYPAAGCMVPRELADSIKRENDITYAILEKRHGKDWKKQFNIKAAEMLKLQLRALKLAEKQRYIKEKLFNIPIP